MFIRLRKSARDVSTEPRNPKGSKGAGEWAKTPLHAMTRQHYASYLEDLIKVTSKKKRTDPKFLALAEEALSNARNPKSAVGANNWLAYTKNVGQAKEAHAKNVDQGKKAAAAAKGKLLFDKHGTVYYGPDASGTVGGGLRPAIAMINVPARGKRYIVGTESTMREAYRDAMETGKDGEPKVYKSQGYHKVQPSIHKSEAEATKRYLELCQRVTSYNRDPENSQAAEVLDNDLRHKNLFKSGIIGFKVTKR